MFDDQMIKKCLMIKRFCSDQTISQLKWSNNFTIEKCLIKQFHNRKVFDNQLNVSSWSNNRKMFDDQPISFKWFHNWTIKRFHNQKMFDDQWFHNKKVFDDQTISWTVI